MDPSEIYMNVKLGKRDSRSPSRAEPDVSYAEINFKTPSAPRVRTDRDGLNSTYSELNFRKEEPRIEEDEGPPTSSGPGRLSTNGQTAAQERESKEKIGNRPYRLICLLCLVAFALVVIVAGLSIHVSQIRQSKITSDRNYHELNSTLQYKISENSHLDVSQKTCLKNLSALNSNLSDLKRMHNDLRHQFTEMETKYRSVNETKAHICELLTSRKVPDKACSQDWSRNEDLCYFISTFESSYVGAKQLCSISDSKLLEISSAEEENFVNTRVRGRDSSYWIGKCKARKVASNVVFTVNSGKFECGECKSSWLGSCKNDWHRFICEKPATLFPDVPEKLRDLCQQPVEPT